LRLLPEEPGTPPERAPQDVAVALSRSAGVSPATDDAIAISLDAVRAHPGGPLSEPEPASPNSVHGTLDVIAATGGASGAEPARRAGISEGAMNTRLQADRAGTRRRGSFHPPAGDLLTRARR
jgi:hypothetical protein